MKGSHYRASFVLDKSNKKIIVDIKKENFISSTLRGKSVLGDSENVDKVIKLILVKLKRG